MERLCAPLTWERDTSSVRFRQSHDWQAASVVKRIGGSLYVTLADGSTRRFHANQMRLRSTQQTEHEFTEFANTFILPVRRPQAANRETGPLDEHAVDHKQETSIQDLELWTTASQATCFWNPVILNEVTFQRNNFSWTQEGKLINIHRFIPLVQVYFPLVFLKSGDVRTLTIITFRGPVLHSAMSVYVRVQIAALGVKRYLRVVWC
jgi:hypothetical protein